MNDVRPLGARCRPLGSSSIAFPCEESEADTVMLWQWDKEKRRWRALQLPADTPMGVPGGAQFIPLARGRQWALLARNGAKVNGLPCLPLEILEDRDEVRIDGEHYCFSAQATAAVVSFGPAPRRIRCARCLGRLAAGDRIVLCPRCSAHHHASCWTYDARCQKCPCPTTHTAWMPDDLG
jgi:hypothetical protein